ncbi:MAG: hypothetical protein ACYTGG_06470 [Planctomycetota bacterium]
MSTFEPLINLLVMLTALSIGAERLTNALKLRIPSLRDRSSSDDRTYESRLITLNLLCCIGLALLLKANFFEVLARPDDPWSTLGWVQVRGTQWVRSAVTLNLGASLYAIAGCVVTGIALGFGSKFWHDVLGAVREIRSMQRARRQEVEGGRDHA